MFDKVTISIEVGATEFGSLFGSICFCQTFINHVRRNKQFFDFHVLPPLGYIHYSNLKGEVKIFTNNERKYQCFICGSSSIHDTYEEFRSHIIDDHEEGREYVLCPLKHCQAPVRDLRIHFKNKHPQTNIPKNCQLKAAVWIDNKGPRKRKPTFAEGYYVSKKNGDKSMHYRSGYELKVYKILEVLGEVSSYHVEPVVIPYIHRGNSKNYIPDLFVCFVDGRKELWEIKPANQKGVEQNRNKWAAATHYCAIRGINFKVITEKEIAQLFTEATNQFQTTSNIDTSNA